jgi:hypothetical protein
MTKDVPLNRESNSPISILFASRDPSLRPFDPLRATKQVALDDKGG